MKQVYVHYLATSENVFDLQDLAATVYQDTPTLIVVNRFSGKDYVKTVNNPFAGAGNIKVINTLTSITGASGFFLCSPQWMRFGPSLPPWATASFGCTPKAPATQGSATHLRSCKYDLNAWNWGVRPRLTMRRVGPLSMFKPGPTIPTPTNSRLWPPCTSGGALRRRGQRNQFWLPPVFQLRWQRGPNCDRDIYVGVGESARFALHPQNSRLTTAVQHAAPQAEERSGRTPIHLHRLGVARRTIRECSAIKRAGFEWILPHPVDETGLTFQFSHSGTLVVGSLTGDPPGEAPVHTVVRSDPDSIEMPLPDNLHENAFPPRGVGVPARGVLAAQPTHLARQRGSGPQGSATAPRKLDIGAVLG